MPDWEPVLVKRGPSGVIATALENSDGITMCVRGGIVLDIKSARSASLMRSFRISYITSQARGICR